jgi:TRAP-type mannitol/chloroaromatic compound transport system permease small subunit
MRKAINTISQGVSWLGFVLACLMVIDIVLRYGFKVSFTWIIDLEWYLFSILFLWGASSTWLADKHVRVDVFYTLWSKRKKTKLNVIGSLIFLIPWCVMGIITSSQYAWMSFTVGEGSPDPNGLGARYLIKFAITIGYILLLISAIIRLLDFIKENGEVEIEKNN